MPEGSPRSAGNGLPAKPWEGTKLTTQGLLFWKQGLSGQDRKNAHLQFWKLGALEPPR